MRRQRLRSATATARFASAWPMMCLSSSLTLSLGVGVTGMIAAMAASLV